MNRQDAATIGGMDRQTLRDWVHRFNAAGPDGLKDAWWSGPEPRLSPARKAELAEIVETGPDPAIAGVVRWRRVDLQKVIKARFNIDYHGRYVSTLLKELGSECAARVTRRRTARSSRLTKNFARTLSAHWPT